MMMKRLFLLFALSVIALSMRAQEMVRVHIFFAEECPICNYMARPLQHVVETYGDRVRFIGVFPKKNSKRETAKAFLEQYDLTAFEIFMDPDQDLTKKMGATVTPEVVITGLSDELLYRGRINDAYYAPGKMKHGPRENTLADALEQITSGKTVPKPWPDAVGCFITFHKQ